MPRPWFDTICVALFTEPVGQGLAPYVLPDLLQLRSTCKYINTLLPVAICSLLIHGVSHRRSLGYSTLSVSLTLVL